MNINDTVVPEQVCHGCGYKPDRATDAFGDAVPKAGDVSICLSCGELAVFTKDLTLRPPTEEESKRFNSDERIIRTQRIRADLIGDKIKDRIKKERE